MTNFTKEDCENIQKLITRVKDITGQEAATVALLQQKIQRFINAENSVEKKVPVEPEGEK